MTARHRIFIRHKAPNAGLVSTYCGRLLFDALNITEDDRKVTCRHCLRAMSRYTLRRIEHKEPQP